MTILSYFYCLFIKKGNEFFLKGDFAKSIDLYTQALVLEPENTVNKCPFIFLFIYSSSLQNVDIYLQSISFLS